MANALRGEVEVGGYTLRYSVNALCEAEAASGQNIAEIVSRLEDAAPSFGTIRLLMWAGLRSAKPALTVEEAGEIVQEIGLQSAVKALGDAMSASLGGDEKEPAGKNR